MELCPGRVERLCPIMSASIFQSQMCAVFAGGSLRRLQLPGDRGGAGHHQQGLHQDVLQSDQAPALAGPDRVRGPPAHRPGSAQRHRDGGQEPLGNSLCPQVCDEVHVLTKNLLPKKSKLIFKQQFLVDNQSYKSYSLSSKFNKDIFTFFQTSRQLGCYLSERLPVPVLYILHHILIFSDFTLRESNFAGNILC